MKKISAGLLLIFVLTAVFSLLVDGTTNALFSSSSLNLGNTFAAGSFEPTLKEKLDCIVADVVKNNVLNGAHQNFNNTNSWSYKIQDYISGGSSHSNIYGYQNPVSANTPPYYGQHVVRVTRFTFMDSSNNNPMVVISNWNMFNYNNIKNSPYFNVLKGSIIFYKPNSKNEPISYFYIDENGELGPLQTLELP